MVKKVNDISVDNEFKYKSDYQPFYSIDYYLDSKEEFKLYYKYEKSIRFQKKDDKFYGTVKIEFDLNNNYFTKHEILLINAMLEKDLDDFIIAYFEKEISKKFDPIYIYAPLSACVVLIGLFYLFRYCCKKKANSNLIADTDNNANLLIWVNKNN